jgi:hypothetical protein
VVVRPARNAVSVGHELEDIGTAVEGVLVLAEGFRHEQFDAEQHDRVPALVVAQLGLVLARIRQVNRVIRGALDPAEIGTRHNRVNEKPGPNDDKDVRLAVWGDGGRKKQKTK